MKKLLATGVLLIAGACHAQAVVTVLGVPVGGKLKAAPVACKDSELETKKLCWVSKPFRSKSGSLLGPAKLPDPDTRPEWAANAVFDLSLTKDLAVEELRVIVPYKSDPISIHSSIQSRFGRSANPLSQNDLFDAAWDLKDIYIRQSCADKCFVIFRSRAAEEERKRYVEGQKKLNAARPVAP